VDKRTCTQRSHLWNCDDFVSETIIARWVHICLICSYSAVGSSFAENFCLTKIGSDALCANVQDLIAGSGQPKHRAAPRCAYICDILEFLSKPISGFLFCRFSLHRSALQPKHSAGWIKDSWWVVFSGTLCCSSATRHRSWRCLSPLALQALSQPLCKDMCITLSPAIPLRAGGMPGISRDFAAVSFLV